MTAHETYEAVIGLEVHVELKTETKVFCGCPTVFGAPPNTLCCPVCMGLPGALPSVNQRAVEFAAKAGFATHCEVSADSRFDRKQYFYPDLPKAYQITQQEHPLCRNGYLEFESEGETRRVRITRIHLEEDAGKLIHDKRRETMLDCNRCGVPLIEIVSAPDLRSAEEAKSYLKELRAIMLYLGISDCRMNEGSLRCDVNLSVRKKGEEGTGIRTELKNLNSFSFVGKAIEAEFTRQVTLLEAGKQVTCETRRFDPATGKSEPMRSKESAADYRYFPEPDLPMLRLEASRLEKWKQSLPELPFEKRARYESVFGLSPYDAKVLCSDPALAQYFDACMRHTEEAKMLAGLLMTDALRLCESEDFSSPVLPIHMASLATLLGERTINSSTAKKLLQRIWKTGEEPAAIVQAEDLAQITDEKRLRALVKEILANHPKAIEDYRSGRKHAAKQIIGGVMAQTGGRADPLLLNRLVEQEMA